MDLMLSDAQTFRRIQQASRRYDIGNGRSLAIPTPLHLIAMKLHALRNPQRFERGIDLQDVKYLIKTAGIDIPSGEFTEILERCATETNASENSKMSGVREEAGDTIFPAFDSLPTAAGLSNIEAFRLSIRHALSLLPALFAKGEETHARFEESRTFHSALNESRKRDVR